MVEYVTQAVLTIHRDLFDYAAATASRCGTKPVRAAASRRVGARGLARSGAVLDTLRRFGFPMPAGAHRRARSTASSATRATRRSTFLARTDILICLPALTDSTRGLLGARVFDALPAGASLVQVGRPTR